MSTLTLQFKAHRNPDMASLYVSERLTDEWELSFLNLNSQPTKQSPLVKGLFGIKGITRVRLTRHEVHLERSPLFSWEELRPDIERVALECLTKK